MPKKGIQNFNRYVTEGVHNAPDNFNQAVEGIFGQHDTGSISDAFGGTLVYAYVPPEQNLVRDLAREEIKRLAIALTGNDDKDLINALAGEALFRHRGGLSEKLAEAAADLYRQSMSPLYKAAGEEPTWTDTHRESYTGNRGIKAYVRKKVEDGVTVGHIVKQPDRGRPRQWTENMLEQMLRSAVKKYKKRNYQRNPTLADTALQLDMPEAKLKKLLLRYGLRYSTYKKET